MSETLLIHYSHDKPAQASWALCNDAGELTTKISSGEPEHIKDIAAGHPVVMLLDSRCLHINRLQLPTQNTAKMLRAVPYALEDYIADDVEDFHFVIAPDKAHNRTAVAGINRHTLQAIIDRFDEAGIQLDSIVPDALCLPCEETAGQAQWVILNYLEHSYFQTGRYTGAVYDTSLMALVLQSSLKQEDTEPPEKLLLFSNSEDDNGEFIESIQQSLQQAAGEDAETEIITLRYNNHPLVVFCGQYRQAMALNLRQGEFKVRRRSTGYLQHWRLAASLAAIWLVLHLGVTAFQLNQLKQKNAQTQVLIKQIYKKAFPQSKKIVNARVQMEQKLKQLKNNSDAGTGLLFLLSESFGTLSHDKKNITLQSLNYRNNRMEIGLDSANLEAIENLNRQLNANRKIKAEISSSSSEKNRVRGNIRIEARS